MTSDQAEGEVGQPPWLPDFVDPADVGAASLDASSTWGQEQPARDATRVGSANEDANLPGRRSRRSSSFGSGSPTTQRRQGKKQLTWAQKQERKEKRAEKRRAQEEAERAKDPMGFAREIVLTQLTAAPKSRAQLAQKLRAKEVDEDTIDAVLDRMEDVGLVDDAAYAGMLVRSQVASRGLARKALAQELQRKGIEGEVATEALEQVDDDAERDMALHLARKKLATMRRLDQQVQTRRLAGLLARKGYPPSMVWSVVKEVQGSFDPDESL